MNIKHLFKPLRLTSALLVVGLAPAALADITCEVANFNQWNSGYTASIRVTNDGSSAVNGWDVAINFGSSPAFSSGWNATYSNSGNTVNASDMGWNGNLSAGDSIEFGFQGGSNGNLAQPTCTGDGSQVPASSTATTVSSTVTTVSSSSTGGSQCEEMCKWYQDAPRPLCTNQASGWGWENNSTCIGRSTCESQQGAGGVISSCQTSSTVVTPPSSSSSSSIVTVPSSSSTSSTVTVPSSSSSSTVTVPSSSSSSSSTGTVTYPARVDNPYAGAKLYVDPIWSGKAAAETDGNLIAGESTFVWMDRIGAIAPEDGFGLRDHLDEALAQGADVFQFVFYDLPNRDCAALASNGELRISENGMDDYKNIYTKNITDILKDGKYAQLRIVALVEVDSLPNLVTNLDEPDCQEANGPGGYREGITYALNELGKVPNVYSYLDVAHSGWLGWPDNFSEGSALIANVVIGTDKGWNSVAGFASNSANYTPTIEPYLQDPNLSVGGQPVRSADFYEWNPYFDELTFVTDWRQAMISRGAPSSLGMLIDTARNGWGGDARPTGPSGSSDLNTYVNESRVDGRSHRGNWCNQPGGVGTFPTAAPAPGVDAYVWVKPQGESDGVSDPNFTPDPNDPAKQHDPMCDPNANNTSDSSLGTGALDNAPHAGRWFSGAFQVLLDNAFPELK